MLRRYLCTCFLFTGAVVADEHLIPIPDPAFTPTANPAANSNCQSEWDAYLAAKAVYADAAYDYAESVADAELADETLNDCQEGGGDCSQEEADAELAAQVVDAASQALSDATDEVESAEEAYQECVCGGEECMQQILLPLMLTVR